MDDHDELSNALHPDDDVLARVRSTLSPLPPVAPQAIARVLTAVHGRPAPRPRALSSWRVLVDALRASPISLIGGGTIVAAVLVSVALVRSGSSRAGDAIVASGPSVPAVASAHAPAIGSAVSGTPVVPAADADGVEAALPVQFVLDDAGATSVALVGDFNDWNASATPMQRVPGAALWTVTLPVQPGRHVYAFVIDGTRWIADPRAPRAADADFGKPGSVLLVNSR